LDILPELNHFTAVRYPIQKHNTIEFIKNTITTLTFLWGMGTKDVHIVYTLIKNSLGFFNHNLKTLEYGNMHTNWGLPAPLAELSSMLKGEDTPFPHATRQANYGNFSKFSPFIHPAYNILINLQAKPAFQGCVSASNKGTAAPLCPPSKQQ
jgi:hypothetical protein